MAARTEVKVNVAKLILFLVLIAIFIYFFYVMVVSFYNAINVISPPGGASKIFEDVRRGVVAIFNLVAVGLLLAFIISLIVLLIETKLRCCE